MIYLPTNLGYTFFLILLFSSCTNSEQENIAVGRSKDFSSIELPFHFKPCSNVQLDKEIWINEGSTEDQQSLLFAQIPNNGNYRAQISLLPADCYVPILTTYSENGQKIDQKTLSIGRCGIDCGFSCAEHLTIGEDLSIYIVDSIVQTQCDENYKVKGTTQKYLIEQVGRINSDGTIQLSNEIKRHY